AQLQALHGPALLVEAARPSHLHVRLPEQVLARDAVQHVEESISIRKQQRLAEPSLPLDVGQNWYLDRVVVEDIVRCELKVPFELSDVGIQGDNRVAVQVVAEAIVAVPIRARIADAPVREV